MENKLKHLEFIQNVISRMANTSFLLKGWSITIIAGLFAFSATEGLVAVLWLGVLLTLVFWFLDSYFLWQERLFRDLYNYVRNRKEEDVDFDMDHKKFRAEQKWCATPFSLTLLPFYLVTAVAQLVFIASITC